MDLNELMNEVLNEMTDEDLEEDSFIDTSVLKRLINSLQAKNMTADDILDIILQIVS